ncbi:MAG: RNA polymerase sigma factor [Planctomycetota bacterium]|jgi:RNA polymerase sigma-70 factor (ECF subfamily)
MPIGDTDLGGRRRDFPQTTMGLVSHLREKSSEARQAALEALCTRYWKPIYLYIRIVWKKPNEDAKDLTQAFFLSLMERNELRKYDRGRGSFRKYLQTVLRGFMGDKAKTRRSLKRGGGKRILPLDDDDTPLHEIVPDPDAVTPEEAYDRAWAAVMAKYAIGHVRKKFDEEGRGIQFRVFEEYDLAPKEEKPTYATVAKSLKLKESDVRNYLFTVRESIHEELENELREMTADPDELREEWVALFGA